MEKESPLRRRVWDVLGSEDKKTVFQHLRVGKVASYTICNIIKNVPTHINFKCKAKFEKRVLVLLAIYQREKFQYLLLKNHQLLP